MYGLVCMGLCVWACVYGLVYTGLCVRACLMGCIGGHLTHESLESDQEAPVMFMVASSMKYYDH